jgi:hypothetical protein
VTIQGFLARHHKAYERRVEQIGSKDFCPKLDVHHLLKDPLEDNARIGSKNV